MGQGAPFLKRPFSAGDSFQQAHPTLQGFVGFNIDQVSARHAVLRDETPCSGCLLEICTEQEMRCLKEIGVDAVVNAIQKIVEQDSIVRLETRRFFNVN